MNGRHAVCPRGNSQQHGGRRANPHLLAVFVVAILLSTLSTPAWASHPHHGRHAPVLAQSYQYHRASHGPPLARRPVVAQHGPPRYTWGFPTTTFRWGWFGASRYYPRSASHRGYNGDHWDWAYRRGY